MKYLSSIFLALVCLTCLSNSSINSLRFRADKQYHLGYSSATDNYYLLLEDQFILISNISEGQFKADTVAYKQNDWLIEKGIEFKRLRWMEAVDSTIYLVLDGGGVLFEFKDSSIVRIDKSFDWKSQISAAQFPCDSTVCKYGGYGLFQEQAFISKYNLFSKEWDVLNILDEEAKFPTARHNPINQYYPSKGYLYILGGSTLKYKHTRGDEYIALNDAWKFDLISKKWEYLGTSNLYRDHPWSQGIVIGDWTYYSYMGTPMGLNLKENKFVLFDKNPFWMRLNKTTSIHYPNHNHIPVLTRIGATNELQVLIVSKSELVSSPISTGTIYKSDFHYITYLYYVVVLVIVGAIYIWKVRPLLARRHKVVLNINRQSLRYKGRDLFAKQSQEIKLVIYISQSSMRTSTEIMEFISEGNQSYELLRKNKIQMIAGINERVSLITGIDEDLILDIQSKDDKRMKDYKINYGFIISLNSRK